MQAEGVFEVGNRVLGSVGLQEGCGEGDVCVWAVGAQANGFAVVRDGVGWPFELVIGHGDAVL